MRHPTGYRGQGVPRTVHAAGHGAEPRVAARVQQPRTPAKAGSLPLVRLAPDPFNVERRQLLLQAIERHRAVPLEPRRPDFDLLEMLVIVLKLKMSYQGQRLGS